VRQRNFSDKRKTKAIIRKKGNDYVLFVSGAPEEIFAASRKVDGQIKNTLEKEAGQGKRIIAVASKEIKPREESFDFEEIEKGMNFSGLICFEDPPRDGVKETIETARKAGVKTIMVTGDYPATAIYVAQKIGILNHHKVLTGDDLNKLSDEKLKEVVRETSVFARATPEDKFRIVKALQKNGEVVAVTGDGTNDVLALKAADIGIAMGKKGTDVAKEGAEIILADDNYITITQGIFEGRRFFDNLQKGVKYYLSVKAALILIFLLPVLIGVPMPFSPIQIIILELFMDLAASAGFVAEPQEKNIYSRPPRDPKENIFNNRVVASVLFRGLILFAAVMTVYFWAAYQKLSPAQIQTFAFSAWIFGHIILAFISRSEKETVFSLGIFTNKIINVWAIGAIGLLGLGIYIPALNQQLNLTRISLSQVFFIFLIAIFIIGILEIKKFFLNRTFAK
jgi:Ca2+-transporting ATPase